MERSFLVKFLGVSRRCFSEFVCENDHRDLNCVVSVRRDFLFLWVLGMGYVILLWHSRSLPYNYLEYHVKFNLICFSIKHQISRRNSAAFRGEIGTIEKRNLDKLTVHRNQNSLLVKRQNINTSPGDWPRKISPYLSQGK